MSVSLVLTTAVQWLTGASHCLQSYEDHFQLKDTKRRASSSLLVASSIILRFLHWLYLFDRVLNCYSREDAYIHTGCICFTFLPQWKILRGEHQQEHRYSWPLEFYSGTHQAPRVCSSHALAPIMQWLTRARLTGPLARWTDKSSLGQILGWLEWLKDYPPIQTASSNTA